MLPPLDASRSESPQQSIPASAPRTPAASSTERARFGSLSARRMGPCLAKTVDLASYRRKTDGVRIQICSAAWVTARHARGRRQQRHDDRGNQPAEALAGCDGLDRADPQADGEQRRVQPERDAGQLQDSRLSSSAAAPGFAATATSPRPDRREQGPHGCPVGVGRAEHDRHHEPGQAASRTAAASDIHVPERNADR